MANEHNKVLITRNLDLWEIVHLLRSTIITLCYREFIKATLVSFSYVQLLNVDKKEKMSISYNDIEAKFLKNYDNISSQLFDNTITGNEMYKYMKDLMKEGNNLAHEMLKCNDQEEFENVETVLQTALIPRTINDLRKADIVKISSNKKDNEFTKVNYKDNLFELVELITKDD